MPIRYSIVWILLLFCALLLCSCSDNQPLVADHLKSTPEWKELINEVSSYQLCQAIAVQNKDELLFFQDQLKHFISINPAVVLK